MSKRAVIVDNRRYMSRTSVFVIRVASWFIEQSLRSNQTLDITVYTERSADEDETSPLAGES